MGNRGKIVALRLRDRWLEQINSGEAVPQIAAKYGVRRMFGGQGRVQQVKGVRLLDAA